MNAKILTVVVGLLMLIPAGFAANAKFGDCPSGYECEERPSGDPFPPDAVTGHTVYAKFVMEIQNRSANTLGLPTDFAAVAGYFEVRNEDLIAKAVQRECVVWFNGKNLDQRPDPDPNFNGGPGDSNDFPSDEDEPNRGSNHPNGGGDAAYQDYDFDRDVDSCVPYLELTDNGTVDYANFAVVVEKGDCAPADGSDFRFRGHLDFVDPNNIYHEVQEYDYTCFFGGPGLGPAGGNWMAPGGAFASVVRDLFPNSTNDPHNFDGCTFYHTPDEAVQPGADMGNYTDQDPNNPGDPTQWQPPSASPTADPDEAYFDLGTKCNGSVQDLFSERLWITPFHDEIHDPTINEMYNFALQIDTCSGINIHEGVPVDGAGAVGRGPGKDANGTENNYSNAHNDPGNSRSSGDPNGWSSLVGLNAHDIDAVDYFLDGLDLGQPLVEVCHDGSSFSFDDTPRGRTVHDTRPTDEEEIMRGNSFDSDPNSSTFMKHRQNCRSNYINWPYNDYPGENRAPYGPRGLFGATGLYDRGPQSNYEVHDDCYPEDHKTARIDIYVYDEDPTGQFALYSNGLTGANTYVQGVSTGPNYLPPQQ